MLDIPSNIENEIPDLVTPTELVRDEQISLYNYKNKGFSIADDVEKQYRDPDEVSIGSEDKIYRDTFDEFDDLMDTSGDDLKDQYVSNILLSNGLTKSAVLTIVMLHLTAEHMSHDYIHSSCNSIVGNVKTFPALHKIYKKMLDFGA